MTGAGQRVFFLINLVQDVNIVRALACLIRRETEAEIGFLVSQAFLKRDRQRIWQRELAAMAAEAGGSMHLYGSTSDAVAVLETGGGLLFAASESRLPEHRETSEVLQAAPSSYLRITLQHGFECVGFLQSREHVMRHGRGVSFAADIVCGWFDEASLTSLAASERAKLVVTGPPTLLQRDFAQLDHPPRTGLVCENLHSVRLTQSGDHRSSFIEVFFAFCAKMAVRGESVTLRPHPGGQYVIKNNVALPANVRLNSLPLYDVNLRAYRYGISAPSTVVFDMMLAGIPVAIWRDPAGIMDATNYEGLTEISTLDDWLAFERDVRLRPEMIIERQDAFLRRLAMPMDPHDVYRRFTRLIVAGLDGLARSSGFHIEQETPAAAGRQRPLGLSGDVLIEMEG